MNVGHDSCNGDEACQCDNPKGHRKVYQVGDGECNRKGDDFIGAPTCCHELVWDCDCEETSSGGLIVGDKNCANINRGFTGGTLGCIPETCQFDTSECTAGPVAPVCGDGIVQDGEECDGPNLSSKTCASMGFTGGTLQCSTCRLDKSQCTGPGPGTQCTGFSCICFSEHSDVMVEGKGMTRMDALKIGDSVQTADGTFSKVYSFGHKASSQRTQYLQVYAASMDRDRPLEISAAHLIYTQDASKEWRLIPAGDLRKGDTLLTADGSPSAVLWIHEVERTGAYAPLTVSGNLLVNGVLASSYVSRNWLKGRVSGLTLHKFQHGAMLPVRFFCSLVGCQAESYSDWTGYSEWVQFWYKIEQWMLTLPLAWRTGFLLLLLSPAAFITLLGTISIQSMSSLVTQAVAVMLGYYFWNGHSLKNKVSGNRIAEIGGK